MDKNKISLVIILIILQLFLINSHSFCSTYSIDSTMVNKKNVENPDNPNYWQKTTSFFKSVQLHGLWDFLTFIIALVGAIWGYLYLVYSKKNIKNLNFNKSLCREENNDYPLKIMIEIRNYTGKSVVITDSAFYLSKQLKPDDKASMDRPTRKIETKFPKNGSFDEVDIMLRHKESVKTWVPLNPNHSDEEINQALDKSKVGEFKLSLIWIQQKPKFENITRNI